MKKLLGILVLVVHHIVSGLGYQEILSSKVFD